MQLLYGFQHQIVLNLSLGEDKISTPNSAQDVYGPASNRGSAEVSAASAIGQGSGRAEHCRKAPHSHKKSAAALQPHVCSETVSVFFKTHQIGFQQPKYSPVFPCVHACSP